MLVWQDAGRVRSHARLPRRAAGASEVLIAGWRPGAGRRTGMIGALLLGMYDEADRRAYVGKVGTGFTEQALRELRSQLTPLERPTSPFHLPVPREDARDAHWVQPRLVGEVAYRTVSLRVRRMRRAACRRRRPG
jgi:bifunctional non-homologous end joining protein LigD